MSSPDNHNPFSPPTAQVQDAPEPTVAGLELASRGSRLGAALLDGLLSGVLTYAGARLIGFDWLGNADASLGHMLPLYLVSFALFTLLQGWTLHTRSQTLGKIAVGIRVVRVDGSRATLGRTLGMRVGVVWVVAMIPVVGSLLTLVDCLFIFGDARRCLHDLIADTIVVKA